MTTENRDARKARTFWIWTLALAVAVSVALNIAHVWIAGATPHRVLTAAVACVAPGFLFLITHGLTLSARAGVRGAVSWAGVTGAVVITAGAFAASFLAIRGLALELRYPPVVAAIIPVVVDATIAVASLMVLALRDAAAATQVPVLRESPAATQPVAAQPLRDAAPVSAAPQNVPVRAAASPELAMQTLTQDIVLRDADAEEIPLTSTASREAAAVSRDAESPKRRLTAVPLVHDADLDAAASSATQAAVVRDAESDAPAKDDATNRDADTGDAFLLRATQLVEAGRTSAAVTDVHRVLRGKAAGMTNRQLAAEVGITDSQVQRISKADRELAGASA